MFEKSQIGANNWLSQEIDQYCRKFVLPGLDSSSLRTVFRVGFEYMPLLMIQ